MPAESTSDPPRHRNNQLTEAPIRIRGCSVHNLKEVDVDIPRGKLVVVCGLSGSGKTSLALDTLYAEGQRCYIESFSAYARQYLDRLDKPDCREITGIPPAIAVTRKGTTKSSRSTVGTATDIADHIRLLFAKAADLFCYSCGQPVVSDDPESIANQMANLPKASRSMIGFPVWLENRKSASEILLGLQQEGYTRLVIADETFRLSDEDRGPMAKKVSKSGIEAIVIVDRVTGSDESSRLTESLETAMSEGYGKAIVLTEAESTPATGIAARLNGHEPALAVGERLAAPYRVDNHPVETQTVDGRLFRRRTVSDSRRCESCDIDYPDAVPRLFNFNNPLGACPTCEGFGDVVDVDMDLVVPDTSKSLREGAIAPWNTPSYGHELQELLELADDYKIPVDVPFKQLKKKHLRIIHEGVPEKSFGGLSGFFAWLDRKKYKMHVRIFAARFRSYRPCPTCEGKRLKPEALAYRIGDQSVADIMAMPAEDLAAFFDGVVWSPRQRQVVAEPVRQVAERLGFLSTVGLGYLQLDRTLRTLSGGETQRVALTTALGSSLVNTLYVLDEPTAGLHPVDVKNLCDSILRLRDRGNTVIAVEHDETLIRSADWLIEVGPEAGAMGGNITFTGSAKQMLKNKESTTGQFLRGDRGGSVVNRDPRSPRGFIHLSGASGHNLNTVDVRFPKGVLCLVTGISGSGKSSLVHDTLYHAVQSTLGHSLSKDEKQTRLPYDSLTGLSGIDECMMIDQSAISRSARSCPVTFVKAFDPIRKVFAETVAAKTRSFGPGHFSFNSAKGQCPQCEGAGVLAVDMQFLADVSMQCPACRGARYREEILQVTHRDRTIAEVLGMTVRQAFHFFRGHAKVQAKLKRMMDVGLEYITLGQSATTLSSGEGQRLKLAAFLGSASRKRTLFILDEPTTGLHFADIVRLVDCFDALIADGHSLIVVEHNAMLMRAADYLIDMGPGAADDGGTVVACGTVDEVKKVKQSATGRVLATSPA